MQRRTITLFAAIIILALIAVYIDLPNSPGLKIELGSLKIERDFAIKQGLDLRGGLQVLLQADLPADEKIEAGTMEQVATIIDNRVNALGVTEPLVQTQGARRIIVELPGVQDPDAAIATLRETGLLEFVDAGNTFLPIGTRVQTTFPKLLSEGATRGEVPPAVEPSPTAVLTATQPLTLTEPGEVTGTATTVPTPEATATVTATAPAGPVYPTVLTGIHLKTANAFRDPDTGTFGIQFELTDEGGKLFSDFTTANADYDNPPFYYLSIVLDKVVVSSPHIKSPIPEGQGVIEGDFTLDEVQKLAIQLRYGALPIPLSVETTRAIGPTLGQDSVQRSIRAGIVGLSVVLLFMLVYYRLPGLLAAVALVLYGLINLAVYKVGWPVLLLIALLLLLSYLLERRDYWPLLLGGVLLLATFGLAVSDFAGVTITLPAITGFILSTGMAVDANILVFERMKEELRAGRSLGSAIEAGFGRAWTSIRDSNISTLITCAILYYFGSTFGAGSVRGFAVTLALGVIINLFTAITVTRTLMRTVYQVQGERLRDSKLIAAG